MEMVASCLRMRRVWGLRLTTRRLAATWLKWKSRRRIRCFFLQTRRPTRVSDRDIDQRVLRTLCVAAVATVFPSSKPRSSKILVRTSRSPRLNMKTVPKTTGLGYWMMRVIEECELVSANFSADPVHDLRVALRRCRSMADGMMAMDPDREWKAMKKAGKQLFQRLGTLRDVQIMMEWIEKLEVVNGHASADSTGAAQTVVPSEDLAVAAPSAEAAGSNHRDSASRALLEILK